MRVKLEEMDVTRAVMGRGSGVFLGVWPVQAVQIANKTYEALAFVNKQVRIVMVSPDGGVSKRVRAALEELPDRYCKLEKVGTGDLMTRYWVRYVEEITNTVTVLIWKRTATPATAKVRTRKRPRPRIRRVVEFVETMSGKKKGVMRKKRRAPFSSWRTEADLLSK